jgi:hypothetical protein
MLLIYIVILLSMLCIRLSIRSLVLLLKILSLLNITSLVLITLAIEGTYT